VRTTGGGVKGLIKGEGAASTEPRRRTGVPTFRPRSPKSLRTKGQGDPEGKTRSDRYLRSGINRFSDNQAYCETCTSRKPEIQNKRRSKSEANAKRRPNSIRRAQSREAIRRVRAITHEREGSVKRRRIHPGLSAK